MNLPIYRAKKIDSDEYVAGFYIPHCPDYEDGIVTFEKSPMCKDTGHIDVYNKVNKIDKTTLAIHFPDMLDSQGNKIFASLSKDGKGGDIMIFCEVEQITGTAIYEKANIFVNGGCSEYLSEILQRKDKDYKIIGIQE
jgi:hypothetical protein